MTPHALQALLRADPFVPFALVLPGGRIVAVNDPGHLGYRGGSTFAVFTDAENYERAEVARTTVLPFDSAVAESQP